MPISTIRIDVDQQTFDNWSLAMGNLAQSFTVPVNEVTPIPGVTLPSSLSFSGVELLNEVGRAATRPDIVDDPDRLFALFRYGTKIATQTPNFGLSSILRTRLPHTERVRCRGSWLRRFVKRWSGARSLKRRPRCPHIPADDGKLQLFRILQRAD